MNVLDSFRLDGRTALVTGGSKGLGQVIATALAEAGANVAVVSRTEAECETTASRIAASTGRRTFYTTADLTVGPQVAAMVDRVQSQFGAIDILVNGVSTSSRRELKLS